MIDTDKFIHDGWVVADIPGNARIAREIIGEFEEIAGCALADIHWNHDDSTLDALRAKMAGYLWDNEYSLKIAGMLQPLMAHIVGVDLLTQYYPYLRVCRPGKHADCFGFHPDSMWGLSPYEVTAQLALTEVEAGEGLQILSGSHRMKASEFKRIPNVNPEVEYGSVKNLTGYPGGAHRHAVSEGCEMTPVVMKPGQVVIFSASMLLHGMEVNSGTRTRVAVDQHFVHARAPVSVLMGKVDTGYVPAVESPLMKVIGAYRNAGN